MKRTLALLLGMTAVACAQPAPPPAPPPPPPPSTAIVNSLKGPHEIVKGYITKAAEQIPEAKYSYRATRDVRTVAQLVGHIANANYLICGYASGQTGPAVDREKLTKKADLQKTLAESFEFCDKAIAGIPNDVVGGQTVDLTLLKLTNTRAGTIAFNTAHDFEHYGNLVTYMRLNNMVPPSTTPPAPPTR